MSAGIPSIREIPRPPPIELINDFYKKPVGFIYNTDDGVVYEDWYLKSVNRYRFWFGFILGAGFGLALPKLLSLYWVVEKLLNNI